MLQASCQARKGKTRSFNAETREADVYVFRFHKEYEIVHGTRDEILIIDHSSLINYSWYYQAHVVQSFALWLFEGGFLWNTDG